MELKNFLKQAKYLLTNNSISKVVVGNESADLDSVISAILLAYAYSEMGEVDIIALINCKKEDYKLRTESYGLLKRYDIDESDLIFIDDINVSLIQEPKQLEVIIVDHNKLPDNLRAWDNLVVAIFDHHQDIGMYKDANPRLFETVGSCSSLVSKFILEHKPEIYKDEKIAILSISPILLDTLYLNKEHGRLTDKDIDVFNKLKAYTAVDDRKLYDDLQFMKSEVSNLSSRDLLRKDYKEWANAKLTYGMCSVPLSIDNCLKKDIDFIKTCEAYMQENSLELLLVMAAYDNDGFKRELIIIALDPLFIDRFYTMLNNSGLDLSDYSVKLKSNKSILTLNQADLGFSRKKIQPLIEVFLR